MVTVPDAPAAVDEAALADELLFILIGPHCMVWFDDVIPCPLATASTITSPVTLSVTPIVGVPVVELAPTAVPRGVTSILT